MLVQECVLLGKRDLLYKVDHARLRIGHLPALGQRVLALVTWQRAPVAEVHAAAGLCVAGHSLPPLRSLLVFCEWREQKDRQWESGEKTQKWGVIHTWTLSSTAEQTFQPSQETERNREKEREQKTRDTRFACQDWCSGAGPELVNTSVKPISVAYTNVRLFVFVWVRQTVCLHMRTQAETV